MKRIVKASTTSDVFYYNSVDDHVPKDVINVIVEDGAPYIKYNAFQGCEMLRTIHISDSVLSIGMDAFNGCKSLKYIDIPKSVKRLCEYAFSDCISLQKVRIPSSVEEIRTGCFNRCESIQSIQIPPNVFEIKANTFAGCSNLREVSLPDTLEKIQWGAFQNCINLTKINIPSSLKSVEDRAFSNTPLEDDLRRFLDSFKITKHAFSELINSIGVDTTTHSYELGVEVTDYHGDSRESKKQFRCKGNYLAYFYLILHSDPTLRNIKEYYTDMGELREFVLAYPSEVDIEKFISSSRCASGDRQTYTYLKNLDTEEMLYTW